jgi:hypothetical protein
MGDSLLDLFYIILEEHKMKDTFFKWAKGKKLLPKRKWFQKRDLEKEEQTVIEAIKKFIETDVPSQNLKAAILSYL